MQGWGGGGVGGGGAVIRAVSEQGHHSIVLSLYGWPEWHRRR